MKKIVMSLLFLVGTSTCLNAEPGRISSAWQRMSSMISKNKLNAQGKKDLVKGTASLALSLLSGALYFYTTADDMWAQKRNQALDYDLNHTGIDPYNRLDKVINKLRGTLANHISIKGIDALFACGPLLTSIASGLYGIKKMASVVKSLRAEQKDK